MEKECPKCGSTMELGAMAGDPTWIREWGSLRSVKPRRVLRLQSAYIASVLSVRQSVT